MVYIINVIDRAKFLKNIVISIIKKIEIKTEILKPDLSFLNPDQKVEACLIFPNDEVKTVPLQWDSSNIWIGEYDLRGQICGTIRTYIQGIDNTIAFQVLSESSIVTSYEVGKNCSYCGNTIDKDGTIICPKCGNQLSIL